MVSEIYAVFDVLYNLIHVAVMTAKFSIILYFTLSLEASIDRNFGINAHGPSANSKLYLQEL